MGEIQHNLEKEKKLIELLGYSLVGPNGSNRWFILDENQNKVGYIQYKKIYNGNSKKGYSKILGYQMVIDSPKVSCDFLRPVNDKFGKTIDGPNFGYTIEIKKDNQENDVVHINFGDYPSLTVWSKKYGFIEFMINYNGLYLNYKTKTDKFNIEEVLIYKNPDNDCREDKKYVYQIGYCKSNLELSYYNHKGRTTREISGTEHYENRNKLMVSERTFVSGKLRTKRDSIVDGTVEEMAAMNQMGIDCFDHFRFLVNQIVPFNKDVISELVSGDMIEEKNLSVFFPDYEKEMEETPEQKKLKPQV